MVVDELVKGKGGSYKPPSAILSSTFHLYLTVFDILLIIHQDSTESTVARSHQLVLSRSRHRGHTGRRRSNRQVEDHST
jgi:hypothetical protein